MKQENNNIIEHKFISGILSANGQVLDKDVSVPCGHN